MSDGEGGAGSCGPHPVTEVDPEGRLRAISCDGIKQEGEPPVALSTHPEAALERAPWVMLALP